MIPSEAAIHFEEHYALTKASEGIALSFLNDSSTLQAHSSLLYETLDLIGVSRLEGPWLSGPEAVAFIVHMGIETLTNKRNRLDHYYLGLLHKSNPKQMSFAVNELEIVSQDPFCSSISKTSKSNVLL